MAALVSPGYPSAMLKSNEFVNVNMKLFTEKQFYLESRLHDFIELIEYGLLTNEMICRFLKRLIGMSEHQLVRSLWTALQPLLHRDFMFSGQKVESEYVFLPISTALSRDIRTHLTKTRNISRYHRVQSAYLTNEDEVLEVNKLPVITTRRSVVETKSSAKEKIHFPEIKKVPMLCDKQLLAGKKVGERKQHSEGKVKRQTELADNFKSHEIREKIEEVYSMFEEWTNPERSAFFKIILPKLQMKQLYFISTYLSVRQNCDFIAKLPKHIALKILSYLNPGDLVRSSGVSKKWRKLCRTENLWEEKCDGVRSQLTTPSVTSRDHYNVYRFNHIRQRNWSRGQCSHTHLEGHDGKVLSVAFTGRMVVSGGADGTVRVWSLPTPTPLQVLTGHTKGVWCVALFTNALVVSGSYDHTIKVWNVIRGDCLRTLYGHTGAVWTLACRDHLMGTGSNDKTIKLWDMRHCKLIHTFEGHSKPVFAVDISDCLTKFFSGSADHSVRIWDVDGRKCLRVIWSVNSTPVMSVSYDGGYLAYSTDKLLNIWDVKSSKSVKTFKGHKCRIETVKISVKERNGERSMSLLSAGRDGKVKQWRKNVKTVVAHKECQVNCIAFDKKRLVTALYDNSICICDFTATEEVDKPLS